MKNFNTDLKKVEDFFVRVLEGKLSDDDMRKEGFSFFGIQGSLVHGGLANDDAD